jgi:hypothetical protein
MAPTFVDIGGCGHAGGVHPTSVHDESPNHVNNKYNNAINSF